MAAGDNEKDFKTRMKVNDDDKILSKIVFKEDEYNVGEDISVDGHFFHNDKLYLVEIDSGNYAKLLVGQYVLINTLFTTLKSKDGFEKVDKEKCVFLVIHYYKDYNTNRTSNALKLVKDSNDEYKIGYKVIHEKNIMDWDDLVSKL